MKSSIKLVLKALCILCFLWISPFKAWVQDNLLGKDNILDKLVYSPKEVDYHLSIKEQLNVLTVNSNITIDVEDFDYETTREQPQIIPEIENKEPINNENPIVQKKIYIYNTHQSEAYQGGQTVMDAGAILADTLEKKGYKVIYETNDFEAYLKAHDLDYNSSYVASNKYLNEAFVNYGGFDLVIDLHRDAIPRESTYETIDGKDYAKVMMVVGGLSKNADAITSLSSTITDKINVLQNGIMRSVMTKPAYYNQEMNPNMILIELGSDQNTFEEIQNSIPYLAEGLAQQLE